MPNPSFAKTLSRTSLILTAVLAFCPGLSASAQTAYDFGNPTADEQYNLELINRARANPSAEGARLAATTDPDVLNAYSYFSVNLAMMQSEFNAIAAAPPLAPNAKLTTTARNHSNWMLANNVQQHDEGSLTPWQRMTNAGYNWSTAGENIYASSKSVWYAHAGFQVDWGYGTGGMQSPRGHRDQIHSPNFREIGVGIVYGTGSNVGPLLVTQDFGTQQNAPTFGTGVAYYDLNSNNFYDPGEGISGLRVDVNGASYYCTTAAGGGWTVPIPTTAATRTVSFTGLNVNQNVSMPVTTSTNAKADLKLIYSPPTITSTATAYNGYPHTLQFNAVGGATSYKWNRWNSAAASAENCESTSGITASTSAGYSVLCTTTKQQGSASFHLATPTPVSQSFELNSLYFGGTSPSISFQSRLGYAFPAEYAKVQVKEEGGTWVDVYSQAGTGTIGESSFTLRSANLTGMAGKGFRVRFVFSFTGGSYSPQTDDYVGWLIDAISFTNVSTLTNNVQTTLATNSGSFTPNTTGTYQMSVAPVISGKEFPAAYQTLTVTSGTPPTSPPSITNHPASVTINSGETASLSVTASGSGLSYQWYQGASGTTTTPVGTNSSSFTTPALTSTTSYWVKVSNSGGSANSNTATVTVTPTVAVVATPVVVTENSASSMVYTFSRTGPTTSPVTVNFAVAGTATLTTDYTPTGSSTFTSTTGTINIPVSASSASVTVTPAPDTTVEPDETVVLTVATGSGYTAATAKTATGTISNDDTLPPLITSHPAPTTVNSGNTVSLTVTATGSGPLSYQWFQGPAGVTGAPVGSNSPTFTSPALTAGTSYWVRVSNPLGVANSTTAAITVITPPVITCQPVSTTVKKNAETFTLSVFASGPQLTYQWYQGTTGTMTNPITGATSKTFTTPTLSSATSYWVRVSNPAGSVNSNTSTISTTTQAVTRTYTSWATELENANSIVPAGTLANNPNGDHDKDGRSNLIECAFGANPIVTNDVAPGIPKIIESSANLTVEYTMQTNLGLTVSPEASSTLNNWKSVGQAGAPAGFADAVSTTSGNSQTRRATIPRSSGPRAMIRMRVSTP